jgi:hypothetical protein
VRLFTQTVVTIKRRWPPVPSTLDAHHHHSEAIEWSPQDLTKDNPRFEAIPGDDYIKQYQGNSELWPVEYGIATNP